MRIIPGWILLAGFVVLLAMAGEGATPVFPKKSPAKKKATASLRKGAKKSAAKRTTWRNRQLTPTPERYKEIQQALAAKGYMKPEEASGTWNQASVDALKNFQSEQNLEPSGKINSLSLIALGLGPKHDTAQAAGKPSAETVQQ